MDNRGVVGAVLTDPSKAFDCLNHELLTAKLNAYGFRRSALLFIHSYLTDRKQRVKVNGSFSTWTETVLGVPQGSVLGPLLFNIYLNDLLMFLEETEICNYADDTTRAPSPFSDHRLLCVLCAYNRAMFVYMGTGSSN